MPQKRSHAMMALDLREQVIEQDAGVQERLAWWQLCGGQRRSPVLTELYSRGW